MSGHKLLDDESDLRSLADRLARCPDVTRFDSDMESESWTLAHSLGDLEDSFRTFLDRQLPRLAEGTLGPVETYELLLDIGEELRHVIYHINDTRFYRYLTDDGASESAVQTGEGPLEV